jgi:hypothetical protein
MITDSDEDYCYQWCGRMRWACVCDSTGRDCNWILARSLGPIVPGRAGSWEKYQHEHVSYFQRHVLGCMFGVGAGFPHPETDDDDDSHVGRRALSGGTRLNLLTHLRT